jgi:hypothetical protein
MPTVEDRPCRALAIRRDSLAASAGWTDDVQMPGVARAGTAAGVPAGPGVVTAPGAPAGPGTSKAASTHACAGHRLHRRIIITLLGQR